MIELVMPIYSKLRTKDKRVIREKCYSDLIMESICQMFRYKTADKKKEKELNLRLEMMLRLYGKVGFCLDERNDLVFGQCHWAGSETGKNNIDYIGYGATVVITLMNGKVYRKKYNEDCVVMFNNQLAHSELNLFRYVEQLSEVDISQIDLLYNARMHPVVVCKDEATRVAVEEALRSKQLGETASILDSGGIEAALLGDNGDTVKVVTITDPQTAQLFQYYSHYHLDLTGRLYGLYGLSTFNTGKMAQTNDLEVSGTLASSMCIPLMNKYWRETGLKEIKELLGFDISVEFTESWRHQELLLMTSGTASTGTESDSLPVVNIKDESEEKVVEKDTDDGNDNSNIRENRIRRIESTGH